MHHNSKITCRIISEFSFRTNFTFEANADFGFKCDVLLRYSNPPTEFEKCKLKFLLNARWSFNVMSEFQIIDINLQLIHEAFFFVTQGEKTEEGHRENVKIYEKNEKKKAGISKINFNSLTLLKLIPIYIS